MSERPEKRPQAILVSVQLPDVEDDVHAANLAELVRLVDTLGYDVVGEVSQRRETLSKSVVLGEGKLKELAALTGGRGYVPSAVPAKTDKARIRRGEGPDDDDEPEDVEDDPLKKKTVIVDHDLSPSQARNLEQATGASVLDRTGVIVEIFHRHARSREARLQVELARLAYVSPRMREAGGPSERQAGRGAGDTALELDRRRIRDRMAEIRRELAGIQRDQGGRRNLRHGTPTAALVGYTNAGKSSLMRALTGSEVLVADQLFATLDTTVRPLHPPSHPRVLITDTVGFIKKLPHDLVASFRSTLDEARNAELLLYIVDASDPTFRSQYEVTRTVLREIEADQAPSLLVLNKIDRVDEDGRAALAAEYPDAVQLSSRDPVDVARLRDIIIARVTAAMTEEEVFIPYAQHSVAAAFHDQAQVVKETHEEDGTRMLVRAAPEILARLKGHLGAS